MAGTESESESETVPVTVRLLERDYQVACRADERQALLDAAQYLNEKMKEVQETGKVVGVERIAVMAALNLAHEALKGTTEGQERAETDRRLRALNEKLDSVLSHDHTQQS